MKLLKPSWVHHDEKPIFSVDVHQDCLKFATGGQGMDSGRVVIWNLIPVLSEKAELDTSIPKMLCQMDNHLACVNCVRWSQNGQMLASGSDDKLIMIWRKSKGTSGIFGTAGVHKTVENWKCVATLQGHSGDVLDLAWSIQDRWLASCSIDNTVMVWDCQLFPNIVVILKGHTGLVKGVAWDPVGTFLATQSDDRSVKIWKTGDWTCHYTITEPFEECGGTTHVLRLSWSPDGQYLVSAHAMNGGGPTAQIIEREGWKCDKDFVGHRKAVTCVRFHNSILKRTAAKMKKPQQYCCLAVGSRDRSLSVWMTALQRPLVVIHELFNDSILDLSWGPENYILMACSGDGTVACLQFSEMELGTPLSLDDRDILYQRIYGKNVILENGSSNNSANILIENPELFIHASTVNKKKTLPPVLPMDTESIDNSSKNNVKIHSTVTSNIHAPPSSVSNSELSSATLMSATDTALSGKEAVAPNQEITSSTIANTLSTTANDAEPIPLRSFGKQLETRASDGRRRITPIFIPPTDYVSELKKPTHPLESINSTTVNTPELSTNIPNEIEDGHLDSRLIKSIFPIPANRALIKEFPVNITTPDTTNNVTTKNIPASTPHQASTTGPKFSITATSKVEFQKTALDYRVHVHNGFVETSTGMLAKVTGFAMNTGEKLWEIFVGSPIVNLNFCIQFVLLCSLDGSIRLLDMMSGRLELPIIALNSIATHCAFSPSGNIVGVVGNCGALRIWDVKNQRNVLSTSCTDIISKHGAVQQLNITDHAVPMLVFGRLYSFCYSQTMQSWFVMSAKDPILRHGLQTTMPKEFQKNYRAYPLTSVQASTLTFADNCTGIDPNNSKWQQVANITFIENQIRLCIAVDSPYELKHWYSMLGFNLAAYGTEQQLRRLLNDLLDDGIGCAEAPKTILTVSKHQLLAMVLNILKHDVKWQRLFTEYNELVEHVINKKNIYSFDPMANTITDKTQTHNANSVELDTDYHPKC